VFDDMLILLTLLFDNKVLVYDFAYLN